MKRTVFFILIMLFISTAIFSQTDYTNARVIRFLELTESEVEELNEMQLARETIVQEAQIEQNLIKAQLEKLLFPADADLRAIEIKMKESLEWRLKVEIANVTLRVEARKLLGETRWRKLLQSQKEARVREQQERATQENRNNN